MSTDAPLVSVVVLAWECRALLARCLASVAAQTHPTLEVIVVDNASTDEPRSVFDDLADRLPRAQWIALPRNAGFAAGMNAGIRRSSGSYLIPLNCDAVLAPDFVANAVSAFARRPDCGALAPLVVRVPPGEDVALDAARLPLDAGAVRLRRRMRVVHEEDRSTRRRCASFNGACPALRREALDDVAREYGEGPFDEGYVTFGEDTDLALRLWTVGWTVWFEPDLVAGHVRSYNTAPKIRDKRGEPRTLLLASRHRNAWRHLPTWRLAVISPLMVAEDVGLAVSQAARGDRSAPREVLEAWRRVLGQRRELLAFRRRHATWRRIPASIVFGGRAV